MVKIVELALRAAMDSFEIYTINSLIKKNETYFIMYKVSFGVAQPKQYKNTIIIIKGSAGSRQSFFK